VVMEEEGGGWRGCGERRKEIRSIQTAASGTSSLVFKTDMTADSSNTPTHSIPAP
jgi:hypothetical protein